MGILKIVQALGADREGEAGPRCAKARRAPAWVDPLYEHFELHSMSNHTWEISYGNAHIPADHVYSIDICIKTSVLVTYSTR